MLNVPTPATGLSLSVNLLCSTAVTIAALLFIGSNTGCSNEAAPGKQDEAPRKLAESTLPVAQQFRQFLEDNYAQDMEQQPRTASRRGVDTDNRRWNSYSEAYLDRRRQQWEDRLSTLQTFDPAQLNESDALSWKLYKLDLEARIARDEFRHHNYILSHYSGVHTRVPTFLANYHSVDSAADAEDYIARLKDVPRLFGEVIEQLKIRSEAGIFLPRWSYTLALESIDKVLQGEPFSDGPPSTIWQDFTEKLDALVLDTSDHARLEGEAKAALLNEVGPAYERLTAALIQQAQFAPAGAGALRHPNGRAFYQERLHYYTTTDLNADEIHALGRQEVARIHDEMRDLLEEIEFEGSLKDFMDFIRNDPQFYLDNTDADRARYMAKATAYIDAMREALPTAFGTLPTSPLVIRPVESYRENSAASAFYQSPRRDGSRPGIYYINLLDIRTQPLYRIESLAYHEALPGHHMQRSLMVELADLPDFQRHVSFTAFTEGWALYAEQLGKEMGFFTDPYSDFGRLSMELWRAVRLVVDTGLHHKGWTMEQAVDYHVDNTPYARVTARKAMERYAARPGQATAYMIGKLKILEIRAAARAALGERFDIRDFHDQVLKDGTLPLAVLEAKMQRWVDEIKART